jgi:hypothetical protein
MSDIRGFFGAPKKVDVWETAKPSKSNRTRVVDDEDEMEFPGNNKLPLTTTTSVDIAVSVEDTTDEKPVTSSTSTNHITLKDNTNEMPPTTSTVSDEAITDKRTVTHAISVSITAVPNVKSTDEKPVTSSAAVTVDIAASAISIEKSTTLGTTSTLSSSSSSSESANNSFFKPKSSVAVKKVTKTVAKVTKDKSVGDSDATVPDEISELIIWKAGESVPYLALANTFEAISKVSETPFSFKSLVSDETKLIV